MTLFAPAALLSLYSCAEDGAGKDLRKGTHLRLFAGLGNAFPLAPFVVFKLTSGPLEMRNPHVLDRNGQLLPALVPGAGILNVVPLLDDGDERRTVRLDLESDAPERIGQVVLLDQLSRRIAARQAPRWMFSAPVLHRLQITEGNAAMGLRRRIVRAEQIAQGLREPLAILGLPVDGVHRWYVGGLGRGPATERVRAGAPLRLNVMDKPIGALPAVSAGDELLRVKALLAQGYIGGGLQRVLDCIVDAEELPWLQEDVHSVKPAGKKAQFARMRRLAALQFAAMDPGIARYLGFAAHFEDFPDLDARGGWDTLAVAGLFAVPRDERGARDSQSGAGRELIGSVAQATGAGDALERVVAQVREKGCEVRACIALTAPTAPWDPPDPPPPAIIDRAWLRREDGKVSDRYRAGFAFEFPALTQLAAVSARLDGDWVTRHVPLEVPGGDPAVRASPILFGTGTRGNSAVARSTNTSLVPSALLAETDLPAEGKTRFRVRASEMFGRFGNQVEFDVAAPPRPEPPRPTLTHYFRPAEFDRASRKAESPGQIVVRVAPEAVPTLADLQAGALKLVKLVLRMGAKKQSVALPLSKLREVAFALPVVKPLEALDWKIEAHYVDSDGKESKPAFLTGSAQDARAPEPYPAGNGLFWTSTPAASPEVELRLSWPAKAGSQHRVYLADEQGIGLPLPVAGALVPARGKVAAAGCQRVIDGRRIDRRGFRLMTDPPIIASANGVALLETTLPRSLSTVQFLRVVPIGPDGAEPPFEDCGIVPIAVPDSRRPASPALEGSVDNRTGTATLRVIADGFDLKSLQQDEPGLFTAGKPGKVAPAYRIRRAVGAVPDPVYARQFGEGALKLKNGVFEAELQDDAEGKGLTPFVRYVYWAEVRLPPERRLPAGMKALNPANGVKPAHPAGALDHPRPLSLLSAPRVLMHVPVDVPPTPAAARLIVTREPAAAGKVLLTLEVNKPPQAHGLAIDRYRLALWTQWRSAGVNGDIVAVTRADGVDLKGTWPQIEAGSVSLLVDVPNGVVPAAVLRIHYAIVDPVGRMGSIRQKDVSA